MVKRRRKLATPMKKNSSCLEVQGNVDDNHSKETSAKQRRNIVHTDEALLSDDLEKLLTTAVFYIEIKKTRSLDSIYSVGICSLPIDEVNSCIPFDDVLGDFWLYVCSSNVHFLYYEVKSDLTNSGFTREGKYLCVNLPPTSGLVDVWANLAYSVPKAFRCAVELSINPLQQQKHCILEVHFTERAVSNLDEHIDRRLCETLKAAMIISGESLELHWRKKVLALMPHSLPVVHTHIQLSGQPLFPLFSSLETGCQNQQSRKHDIQALYRNIKRKPPPQPNVDTQHPILLPKLREYQSDAANWMISKERGLFEDGYQDELTNLFKPLKNSSLFFNWYSYILVRRIPRVKLHPGGILADEMGLGKTVEVLACILCNPKKEPSLSMVDRVQEDECDNQSNIEKSKLANSVANDIMLADANTRQEPLAHGLDIVSHEGCTESKTDSLHNLVKTDNTHNDSSTQVVDQTKGRNCGILANGSSPYHLEMCAQTPLQKPDAVTDVGLKLVDSINELDQLDPCQHIAMVNNERSQPDVTNSQDLYEFSSTAQVSSLKMPSQISERFECACGGLNQSPETVVQCTECSLRQHAECVGYDVEDPLKKPYKCPHCHTLAPKVKSSATLIVTPSSIKHQWMEEIQKHIDSTKLRVMEYAGVSSQNLYIQPSTLARQDIVITTYAVLSKELVATCIPHSNSEHGRQLRKPKKFMAMPSSLVCVEWWRVCLDEAQMVESVSSRTAEMALKLSAVNRWCVTGTPISTGVNDLYGLLLFLGVAPFWMKSQWDAILYKPYCSGEPDNLHNIIRHVMWRNSKSDVMEQLGLQPPEERLHKVSFVPVEEHFYRQQYHQCKNECLRKVAAITHDPNKRLDALDRHTLNRLLEPLLRMRQACCHPQVVRGEFSSVQRGMLTMDQLLEQMSHKTQVNCEESHRQIVAALNGEAGLLILQDKFEEAVENYREVLRSAADNSSYFRTDDLQMLHTVHNLRELIRDKKLSREMESQLECGKLEETAQEIREKYTGKADANMNFALSKVLECRQDILDDPLINTSEAHIGWWWSLTDSSVDPEGLVVHVQDTLMAHLSQGQAISFRSLQGLLYTITDQWKELVNNYFNARSALEQIQDKMKNDPSFITSVVECCLRPSVQVREKCLSCSANQKLTDYEYRLFHFTERFHNDFIGEDRLKGTWADSVLEQMLKAVLNFARSMHNQATVTEQGQKHVKLIDTMKKEFKHMRAFWMALRERMSTADELSMAVLRFQLQGEDDLISSNFTHIIAKAEIEVLEQKQISDGTIGRIDLEKNLRHLKYLRNLASDTIRGGQGNEELCPICRCTLGNRWAVFSCCHCYCCFCMDTLFQGHSRAIRCAVCRISTHRADISYVVNKDFAGQQEDRPLVKGGYSSKVTEVVHCLRSIEMEDPGAKILLFSSWMDLLDVMANALTENNIKFKQLKNGGRKSGNFLENLLSFRHDTDIEVLLLPVSTGANGLNLTEANHVIFMEPLLSQSIEAQAIGRIYRIGQIRQTFVHRIIVNHSIEENIHSIISLKAETDQLSVDDIPLTIADLTAVFQ